MRRAATILGLTLLLASPALAQPTLRGKWTAGDKTSRFNLNRTTFGTYLGTVISPTTRDFTRLDLRRKGRDRWELALAHMDRKTVGIRGRLDHELQHERWIHQRVVTLVREGDRLTSKRGTFVIYLPEGVDPRQISGWEEGDEAGSNDGVAPLDSTILPVVKVLITGFDRFPRPKNHPRWVQDGQLTGGEPRINPAGWVVRNFTLENLSQEFRGRVQVELHKCLDVPVTYVNGAGVITETIERLQPDVVISFGVGADSGSADVEKTCSNVMDDSWLSVSDYGQGPFQLPASWPPEGNRADWSEEDRLWLSRYPDNAGVSYNGAKIDPQGPDRLTSLLPVDRIVRRVRGETLHAIDGGSGPGRYICNNVMYRVIQAQAKNGRLGGFIHLAQWSESRRDNYLKVVACAVEESANAWLESQVDSGLAGTPVLRAHEEPSEDLGDDDR